MDTYTARLDSNPQLRNWIIANLILKHYKTKISNIVKVDVRKFHKQLTDTIKAYFTKLKANITTEDEGDADDIQPETTNTDDIKSAAMKAGVKICECTAGKFAFNTKCKEKGICSMIYKEFNDKCEKMTDSNYRPTFYNEDKTPMYQWIENEWNLAKCFMPKEIIHYLSTSSTDDTDLFGTLHVYYTAPFIRIQEEHKTPHVDQRVRTSLS